MKYILVLGYGWSGSSAVIDLLNEYENTFQIPIEFRLIKDPHGLMDLRYNLVDRWDPLNVDIAIKDFLWLAKCLNQDRKSFPCKAGLGYNSLLEGQFIKATKEYVNCIAPITYKGNWFYFDYYKRSFQLFKERLIKKLKLNKDSNQLMYYTTINQEKFDEYSMNYIDAIFSSIADDKKLFVLDQAVPAQDPLQAAHFFRNYKIIIVSRDARDNYCDLVNQHALIGDELSKHKDIDFYKNWYLGLRSKIEEYKTEENILYISFESLIKNYDTEVKKIEEYVGLNEQGHIHKKELFNPDISINNIGIWKEYDNQEVIQEIVRVLPDFISEYAE